MKTEADEIDSIFSSAPPKKAATTDTERQETTSSKPGKRKRRKEQQQQQQQQQTPVEGQPEGEEEREEDGADASVKEVQDPSVSLLAQSNKKQKLDASAALNDADADLFDSRGHKREPSTPG